MPTQRYANQDVELYLLKNTSNISLTTVKYVLSVVSDEYYDANLTTSKLDITLSNEYTGTWSYNDEIYCKANYYHLNGQFISEKCTLDYVEDSQTKVNQSYTLSCLGENLQLIIDTGSDNYSVSNKTFANFLSEFASFAGVTLSTNVISDIYMGTIADEAQPATSPATANYNSRIEALRDSFRKFGYIGSLTKEKLKAFRLSTPTDQPSVNYNYYRLLSASQRRSVYSVAKTYLVQFVNRTGGNVITTLQLNNPYSIGENTKDLTSEGVYYNYNSAYYRALGEMYNDYYESNKYTFEFMGWYTFKAGDYFNCNVLYSPTYDGLYINLRTTHRIMKKGWITTVEAFKMDILEGLDASFRIYPLDGSYNIG